jgi:hypothetical protein
MLYLGSWSGTSTYSNKWSIYQESTTEKNYFGSTVLIGTNTNSGYKLDVSGTVRGTTSAYFATSSGSVGISTTNPSNKLEVIVASSNSGVSSSGIAISDGAANRTVLFMGVNTASYSYIQSNQDNVSSRPLVLNGSGGNVGIGLSNPTAALHLSSTGRVFQWSGATTGIQYFDGANTGANLVWGMEGSAGGILYSGSSPYSAVFGNENNYPVQFGTNATIRMTISSGGNVGIATAGFSDTRLAIYGVDGTSSNYCIVGKNSSGQDLFVVRNDGVINTGTRAGSPYNNTSANVANLYVSAGGTLERATASSQRFKENIKDWSASGLDTILALKPKTFTYKANYYKNPELEMLGLIAEEVAEVCPFLAEYQNEDRSGQVENVRYATIVVPLIKAIQEQNQIIQSLQEQINILAK